MLEDRDTRDSGHDDTRKSVRSRRNICPLLVTTMLICALTLLGNRRTRPQRGWFIRDAFGVGAASAFLALRLSVLPGWLGPEREQRPLEHHRG